MAQHMKKLALISHNGNDSLHFYDIGAESGDEPLSHIRIVHLQEWSDLVGEDEAEDMAKYNVVTHDVCVYGYDGQSPKYAEDIRTAYGTDTEATVGQSVHDALKSCGYRLDQLSLGVVQIIGNQNGEIIAQGLPTDPQVALVVAEAMYVCGTGERLLDESGNNARHLLRDARRA